MKSTTPHRINALRRVAPPRGERGLKCRRYKAAERTLIVAPPRGERGLKSRNPAHGGGTAAGRSPSWGAWIEIHLQDTLFQNLTCRSPSWGAWIEIDLCGGDPCNQPCRSPSWGAWIEILSPPPRWRRLRVAPPRGERGLKFIDRSSVPVLKWSLPLVGSVD